MLNTLLDAQTLVRLWDAPGPAVQRTIEAGGWGRPHARQRRVCMRRMNRHLIMVIVPLMLHVSAPWCWAGFQEGYNAFSRGDYATALREWLPLAQQGDARAQGNLGGMYDLGLGVPRNSAEAVKWYQRAAEQGLAGAQYDLGVMYHQGRGIPQNYGQAIHWFRRAADQGVAIAQFHLGQMYELGLGVPQDFVQAYFWLNLAAARLPTGTGELWPPQYHDDAVGARDWVAQWMTPAQLAQAQECSRTWQPKPETPSALLSPRTPPAQPQELPLVWRVQARLKAVGFDPGPVDGAFGPQTRDALRWFQNSEGLAPTGELDEQTLNALGVR